MSRLKKGIIAAFMGQPLAHRGWTAVYTYVKAEIKREKAKAWEQGALYQRDTEHHLKSSNPYKENN